MHWHHIVFFPLALLRFILLCLVLVVFLFGYLFLSAIFFKHNQERAYKLRRIFLVFVIPIMGIKIEVTGKQTEETALYVCNHRSFTDPVIVCYLVDANVIAKAEVGNMPILDKGARLTGIIYVDRDSLNSRKSTREMMVQVLKEGLNILVFPEGTTTGGKRTLEYRMGTFKEAATHGFPVVPIALEYRTKYDMWVNRSLIKQFFYQYSKPITRVKMVIGEPIKSDDMLYLREYAETWTNERIEELHVGWSSLFDVKSISEKA